MVYEDPYLRHRVGKGSKDGVREVICPWCKLECDGMDGLKAHMLGQHPKEKRQFNEEELDRIAKWHNGDINVIDI